MARPLVYFTPDTSAVERNRVAVRLAAADLEAREFGRMDIDVGDGRYVTYSTRRYRCDDCLTNWEVWAVQLQTESDDAAARRESWMLRQIQAQFPCPFCVAVHASVMSVEQRRAIVHELAATGADALAEMAVELDQAQSEGRLTEQQLASSVRADWHHPDDLARIAWLERELVSRGLLPQLSRGKG
jgi:hypothetical protein